MKEGIMKSPDFSSIIAKELGLTIRQVHETIRLLNEGNTIPFIARYRKEATDSLDEEVLRSLSDRYQYLMNLQDRKEEVARLIFQQEKLTKEIQKKIEEAVLLQELEDIYRPFRPKRRTRATLAREKGLLPFSQLLFQQDYEGDVESEASKYLDKEKGLEDIKDVIEGSIDILAETISDSPEYRDRLRPLIWKKGTIQSTREETSEGGDKYKDYFDFQEPLSRVPHHRVLALNRGQKEEVLKVKINLPKEDLLGVLKRDILKKNGSPVEEILITAISLALNRFLRPSLEREVWRELLERAEEHAIGIFAKNLRRLLLQPPLGGKRVLAIDPAYRTGCKVALIGPVGEVEETFTIYPHAPVGRWQEALIHLQDIFQEKGVFFVAIGNGTASRETEELISELAKTIEDLQYIIIDEAGASVYSASPLAREELPGLNVEMRGAVSIGRRLQDPLAELVKINPRSIGVGLYQHDLNEKKLEKTLEEVVESCVNYVGVDINTASPYLLQYVAGINKKIAQGIFQYRLDEGPFQKREDLLKVKGMGPKSYQQSAGFLHLFSPLDPLAKTPIHPESYGVTWKLLKGMEIGLEDERDWMKLGSSIKRIGLEDLEALSSDLQVGVPTLQDIFKALSHPGRDPREDLPAPIFHKQILRLEDLQEGMILKGTVRNVVDFGAFVDIGIKEDGLLHISNLGQKFVSHPLEVIGVGDVIEVLVMSIDVERKRIGLKIVN